MTKHQHQTLVSTEEAWRRFGEPDVTFLDCRWYLDGRSGAESYRQGHIPGAVFVDLDLYLADHQRENEGRHPLPDPEIFLTSLCDLGLTLTNNLIAYDDAGGVVASRFWWMGTELGLNVGVLDGGLQAWPGPLTTDDTPLEVTNQSAVVPAAGFSSGIITITELMAGLYDGTLTLTDARDGARYRGEIEPIDPRPGHIPGARSLPSSSLLKTPGGPHRSSLELNRMITETLGSDISDQSLVTSCGSGVTACHTILVLEHVLQVRPRLFVGSYSQWSRESKLPVATGPEPGSIATTHPSSS